MFGFLKSLFAENKPTTRPKVQGAKAPPPRTAPAPGGSGPQNGERATLLKRAQEVHRAKRKILDHLSDEDRAKLVGMAILTFLNEGREPDDKK